MFARYLGAIRTVFLDRDGTLNVKPLDGEYITSPADLIMLPGAARAVAQLNAVGVRTVLVSNQRWLSGPTGDPACFVAIHARLEQLLAAEGAWLDVSYYCPHAIGSCECRKPGSGMLRRAAKEYGIDLAQTVIVGDSHTDLEAGRSVGAATILLRANDVNSTGGAAAAVLADAVADDLPAAVRIILQTLDQAGLRHAWAGPPVMSAISGGLSWPGRDSRSWRTPRCGR